jgi:hypothetical protein
MKNIILEEINRAKLLMNYDNNNTLSENVKKVTLNETIIISEQPRKAFLKAILGTADDAALATIRNARSAEYIAARNLFNDVKIYGKTGLSSGDEVLAALIDGTLKKAQISELAKGLMKTGKATGSLRTTLTDTAGKLAANDARYAAFTEKQLKNSLIKKGYDPAIADEIAVKFARELKPVADKIITTTPIVKTFDWAKLKKWGIRAGVAAGVLYIIYKMEHDDEPPIIEPPIPPIIEPPIPNPKQYRSCPETLPIAKFCKNETIRKVQGCLGITADSLFGPKTQAALEAKGVDGTSITQQTVDKVCNNAPLVDPDTEDVDGQDPNTI